MILAAKALQGFVNLFFHSRTMILRLKDTATATEDVLIEVVNAEISYDTAKGIVGNVKVRMIDAANERVHLSEIILCLARKGCLRKGRKELPYTFRKPEMLWALLSLGVGGPGAVV